MKLKKSSNDTAANKKKSTWHRWFFGVLYLVIVVALFALFYNFVVRDEHGSVDDDAAATTGKSVYDTLDVLGDYLWPGMKLDTYKDKEEKEESKEDKKNETRQSAPIIQAEAATDADIEEATGLSAGDPATASTPAADGPKVEQLESPKVEQLESPAQ